jgi:hypothetical protein
MKKGRIINKTIVTRAVIIKIKDDENPDVIKATHIQGYDDPDKIGNKGNDEGYKPDIVASKENETNIFEIELDDQMPVNKWRLFSEYANKNNGNLFLVVPDYLKESIKKEMQKQQIRSRLIYFETQ